MKIHTYDDAIFEIEFSDKTFAAGNLSNKNELRFDANLSPRAVHFNAQQWANRQGATVIYHFEGAVYSVKPQVKGAQK